MTDVPGLEHWLYPASHAEAILRGDFAAVRLAQSLLAMAYPCACGCGVVLGRISPHRSRISPRCDLKPLHNGEGALNIGAYVQAGCRALDGSLTPPAAASPRWWLR